MIINGNLNVPKEIIEDSLGECVNVCAGVSV